MISFTALSQYVTMYTSSSTSISFPSPPLLAELFAGLPHGVIAYEAVRDADGLILDYQTLFYNPQALAIKGHTPEQMTQQLLFQRSPYLRIQADSLRQVVENQTAYDYEELIPISNRWFAFENRPLGNGFFTIIRDIDALKQAEQQLAEQNESLRRGADQALQQQRLIRSVLDTSPIGITVEQAIRDETGDIIDFQAILINPTALAMGGHTEELALSRRISELNPTFRTSGLMAAYQAVISTGEPFHVEFYHPPLARTLEITATRMDQEHLIVLFNDVTQARQDALALQQKNELLNGVLRTSESGIIVFEAVHDQPHQPADFRLLLTNQSARRMFGLEVAGAVGQLLTEIRPATRETGLWKRYNRVYQTGQTYQGQYFDIPTQQWFDVTINKLGDGLVATFNDITQAQLARQQIDEQARLFNGVLCSITNGLSILDLVRDETGAMVDLRYVHVSQTILHDTGRTKQEMIGNTILSLFPGVRETKYWTAYQEVARTGKPQRFEVHYTAEGFDNYMDNWVTRLDENRIISIYAITNDQKRVEIQAKQHAATLQSVLDSCQLPIVLLEPIRSDQGAIIDFRYVIQNEASARILGHPVAETTSRTVLEVIPGLQSAGIFDRYVAVYETGLPQQFEQHLSEAPMVGWFDFSVVRQDDGIVVAINDQTLLRQTLQRAEQLVIDLRRSNSNLEQFAYVASHDLQEPLRKIQSFGDVLMNQFSRSLSDEAQDLLLRMQSAASRMSLLIRDLLTYSRLATQQEPFKRVDLTALIAEVISDFELTIAEKNAQVISNNGSGQPLPVLNGNAIQLRQLFQNLIGNALKFARPGLGPVISITAQPVGPDDVPVAVQNRTQHSWIAIVVSDNGIGFDEQYQERIFQLFERLHGRSEYAGTGIGLAVCRKVAENHQGTIAAHSQPGQGATFTVYLPVDL
ncbi:ATP-binding protein [Spirosoma sordidisoli]|nr:ATP-binding protein [Spirosoma sordidisoli]